jgi:hypothetical protein
MMHEDQRKKDTNIRDIPLFEQPATTSLVEGKDTMYHKSLSISLEFFFFPFFQPFLPPFFSPSLFLSRDGIGIGPTLLGFFFSQKKKKQDKPLTVFLTRRKGSGGFVKLQLLFCLLNRPQPMN